MSTLFDPDKYRIIRLKARLIGTESSGMVAKTNDRHVGSAKVAVKRVEVGKLRIGGRHENNRKT